MKTRNLLALNLVLVLVSGCQKSANSFSYLGDLNPGVIKFPTGPLVEISPPSVTLANNTTAVSYTVTYSRSTAYSLTVDNIILNQTETANCKISSVTGPGPVFFVDIMGCTGAGTAGISISPGTSSDNLGNKDAGAGPSATFTVKNGAPVVNIGPPSQTLADASSSVSYLIAYSGANTVNLTLASISLNQTGTSNCKLSSLTRSGFVFTLTVDSCAGEGAAGISVARGTSTDALGATDVGAGPSATFQVDNTLPIVGISAPSIRLANSSSTIIYTVVYSGAKTIKFTQASIILNQTGTASCNINSISGTGPRFTVSLGSCAGNGSAGISILGGASEDEHGLKDKGAGPSITFNVDSNVPVVTIGAPSPQLANIDTNVTFPITYNGASTYNLTPSSVTMTTTGGASCSLDSISGTAPNLAANFRHCTGVGTFRFSISPGTSRDALGVSDLGAGPSAFVTVDNSAPVVTISNPSSELAGPNSSIQYTVTYAGASTYSLALRDITLNKTGTARCTISGLSGSGPNYTVTIDSCTGTGTAGISVAAGTSQDPVGNADRGAGPSSVFQIAGDDPIPVPYNFMGIVTDGSTFRSDQGFDHDGNSFSASCLHRVVTTKYGSDDVVFNLGPPDDLDMFNGVVTLTNLPQGNYRFLYVLASGVNGQQLSGNSYLVTYTDNTTSGPLTQNVNDWANIRFTNTSSYKNTYFGEGGPVAFPDSSDAARNSPANIGCPYRNIFNGSRQTGMSPFYVYTYRFSLDNTRKIKSIRTPGNINIQTLAISLAP